MALLSQPVEDWRERPDPSDGRASRRQGDSPDPLRVMIVEDDFLVAMTIEQAIRGAGMEVVGIAPTRKKALALCQAERPDFATMDINLRGDQAVYFCLYRRQGAYGCGRSGQSLWLGRQALYHPSSNVPADTCGGLATRPERRSLEGWLACLPNDQSFSCEWAAAV